MTILSVAADTNEFRFGTQSLKVTTGDTGSNALYPNDAVATIPGLTYTFSAYIKTSGVLGSGVRLRIAQAGTLTPALADGAIVTDSSADEGSVNGWLRMELSYVIPEGVLSVRPIVLYTGTTLGEVFWMDGIKFEEGDLASFWLANIVSKRLVVDQGAVQIDGSLGGLLRLKGSTGGTYDTVSLGTRGLVFGGGPQVYAPDASTLAITTALQLEKAGGTTSSIIFPAQTNDPGYIKHIESSNTAEMQHSVSDDRGSADSFTFGSTQSGSWSEALRIRSDGYIEWSGTGLERDVNLYRSAANELKTDDALAIGGAYISGATAPIVRVYTSGATWTKPTGLHFALVEVQGGGGSAGGSATTTANNGSCGGGGGGGGYARKLFTAANLASLSTATVTVGGTKAGTIAAAGSTGNASSFAGTGITTVQGNGGGGGGMLANGNTRSGVVGGAGGTGTGGDINIPGDDGASSWRSAFDGYPHGEIGMGGGSRLGGSTAGNVSSGDGNAGANYGGGGSGAYRAGASLNHTGGGGAQGIVIVTEFYAP